ncbi:RNA methyltransferase [Chamaesiphon minutus]|uniref:tRNA (cytidine/uridine-2'-O-)-methyltransferase TrmJ n=1 Tax=Chamaesiphon minutus (strain ATCC 27169 / PCC 6605) TaxID=1173020 RepID=K9UQ21_CHAP6|nr:RNA methyltransferase [Chamaesiphon minutus]AFY96299.1 RNA methyltransferase, TrmH family, group 1 [Chamaesiphon minutus PCC 6605]
MSISLNHIRIVLVEPAGARNIGSISRVMKNMGLTQLVIVNPRCEAKGEEASMMAVHAIDLLQAARIVPDLITALAGCTRVIATTARDRGIPTQLETPRQALPWLVDRTEPTALIFGREDSGLTNTELNYATRYIRIPVGSEYSSLNLAQAVGICAYEIQMCASQIDANLPTVCVPIPQPADVAPVELLEGYYQQLETLLLKIGYLFPHTAAPRMEKLRRLYNRSQLSPNEVALLRGMLRQVQWAIDRGETKT